MPPQVVARYDYVDEENRLLFQVERLQREKGKSFRCRRPDGDGGWVYNMDDTRRVLYRLPQVIAAVAAGQFTLLVEGERDVQSLEAAGRVATTAPHGAGKWRPEYAQPLHGAKVAIIADADAPGRKHALRVATELEAAASKVIMYEPAPPHKDVTEHLDAGLPLSDLIPIDWRKLKPAPKPEPEPKAEPAAAPPNLRLVVDSVTGEVVEPHGCDKCQELEDQLNGAQREIRGWRTRYAELAREKNAMAQADPLWPVAMALFKAWKEATGHKRAQWTFDRYFACEPLLRKYGAEVVERAIAGISYDCYQRPMRNGAMKRYDDWGNQLFKDAGHLEEYANRAPKGWTSKLRLVDAPPPLRSVASGKSTVANQAQSG